MGLRVFRSVSELPADFGPSAVTIGNFDGVHLGHRLLMHRVVELARQHSWKASVITFDPHPTKVMSPARAPHLLTTVEQRIRLMAQSGVEQVFVVPFSPDISRLSPEEFAREFLHDHVRARAVVVGDNFRFGSRQSGDTALLRKLGGDLNFRTEAIAAIAWRGIPVSSSEIRRRIGAGDIRSANRLLASCYGLEGEVVHGHGIGSRQTVPTLNLATRAEVIPATGVYITRTFDRDSSRHWHSVSNVGYRPTFGGDSLSIETFLLSEFDGKTPSRIRVEFLRRLREERRFDSVEALRAQILRDVARSKTFFRRTAKIY